MKLAWIIGVFWTSLQVHSRRSVRVDEEADTIREAQANTSVLAEDDVAEAFFSVGAEYSIPVEVFGYNQINGPVFQIPYDDARLMEVPRVLWAGHLRFPGGTVANYWSLNNGTYVDQDCHKTDGNGKNDHGVKQNYCKDKVKVDAMGKNIFTPKKFIEGFGSASPVRGTTGPLYDINVLTLKGEDIKKQLNYLRWLEKATGVPVRWIEFGNEFFIRSHYGKDFPDAQSYIDDVREGLVYARQLFGQDVKLAVPMGYPFCTKSCETQDKWNKPLQANQHLFDAITIHDYTACTASIDGDNYNSFTQRTSALLAWGEAAIEQQQICAAKYFKGKEIWMTEWNYATFVGLPFQDDGYSSEKVAHLGTSAIFRASYLLAMLINSAEYKVNRHTAGHTQHLNELDGQGHGKYAGVTKLFDDGLYISGVGQIMSHISYIALYQARSFRVVSINGGGTLKFAVKAAEKKMYNLKCIFAVQFNTDDSPITVAINRCHSDVTAVLTTNYWQQRNVRTCTYRAEAESTWMHVDNLPKGYAHPWRNGPLAPSCSQQGVRLGQTKINLRKTSLSVLEFVAKPNLYG